VKVLEAAGGFAPTLGIMGAVLGLIQVMQRMDNVDRDREEESPSRLCRRSMVSDSPTCFFLPLAGKLRIRLRQRQLVREMMLDAVISIMDGLGPLALRQKLECYIVEHASNPKSLPQPELVSQ
jgi:chemotaxis protein MotA